MRFILPAVVPAVTGLSVACGGGGGSMIPAPGHSPHLELPPAPSAFVGTPYNLSFRWTVNTAKPPYVWSVIGTLPPGLQCDPANARVYRFRRRKVSIILRLWSGTPIRLSKKRRAPMGSMSDLPRTPVDLGPLPQPLYPLARSVCRLWRKYWSPGACHPIPGVGMGI